LTKVRDLHLCRVPKGGVVDLFDVDSTGIGEIEKYVFGGNGGGSSLGVPEDEVNPQVKARGDPLAFEGSAVQPDEVFGGGRPGGEGYVVDDFAVLGREGGRGVSKMRRPIRFREQRGADG